MFLKELPNIRIEKYPKGFVVEIQKRDWFGRKYWTHLISADGLESTPWHYDSFDRALTDATGYLKDLLIKGTHQYSLNIKNK